MGDLQAGYGLDSNGYIVSDVGLDKIDNVYLPVIQESVASLATVFPQQLHGVYVYGSVARGEAVAVKSDLDLLVIFNNTLTSQEAEALQSLSENLSHRYRDLVRDVGIAFIDLDYVVDSQNYDEQAFLKELCVCVHGEDLRPRFGPYKLTSEIAIRFNGDMGAALPRTTSRLREASSDNDFKTIAERFARKLIRTNYSMVMLRSQIWTTRLHEQADVFLHHFPQKEAVIRTLQQWLNDFPSDRAPILDLFQSEGEWIIANFEREARVP
ncbi:nucleotidyltransferase-like protein [Paenibacillus taihuensis]|uniref:Nucleotidyltransferase-like protein n=1 Tax=Paenibacillus taihuensis TaxID=1156355 RepID=A0A3D9R4F5_9BACL|nr:nucleotidyltransferase domain-containing protein [Paenibacillus taihuensis]REE68717.1 nucleotidyltransferase-like protein [Paenibacillus taihuensis]